MARETYRDINVKHYSIIVYYYILAIHIKTTKSVMATVDLFMDLMFGYFSSRLKDVPLSRSTF